MNSTRGARVLVSAALMFVMAGIAGRAAAQPKSEEVTALRAAIDAANKKFSEGIAKKDAALVASVYTEDAQAFPPNSEVVKGREAIQKMWQSIVDSGVTAFELVTTEVDADGHLAYEVGTYALKTKDGAMVDHGKYCVVWKRVKGEWLLHRDIWSTSMPAPKAAE